MQTYYLLLISFVVLSSCNESSQNKNTLNQDTLAKPIKEVLIFDTTVVNQGDLPVLKKAFILSRDSVLVKQADNVQSKTMEKLAYGDDVEVVEDKGGWYGVWSKDRYSYADVRDGHPITISASRKVYIPKESVGDFNDLKLYPEDLMIVTSISPSKGKNSFNEKGIPLKKYLDIALIPKTEYDKMKLTKVDYLDPDTLKFPKESGKLILPTQRGDVTFIDHLSESDDLTEYNYLGQIPLLNSYLVQGKYWESADFTLLNKETGGKSTAFIGFPHISPSQKNSIALYTNPYEQTGDLELYTIKADRTLELIVGISFKHWMIYDENSDAVFFANDGNLYAPVSYAKSFWDETGHISKPSQYLRIKIL